MDYETEYNQRLAKLNSNQRLAVETIEGPVMVVAGPGTGKTELLGMRVASILRQTDSLPENILCLTFTDAGSLAMQKRLIDIIGKSAYDVSINTFHSFGVEVINQFRQYFYNGAEFRPADPLNQRRIIIQILDGLDHNDPLRTVQNGEYTNIGAISTSISEMKKAGLTAEEFIKFLDSNQTSYQVINPLLIEALDGRMSSATLAKLEALVPAIEAINEPPVLTDVEAFSKVFLSSLKRALAEAKIHPKTTPPLTAWKNTWTTKNGHNQSILKAVAIDAKLRSFCQVYQQYLQAMEQEKLYDYDDMIMQVVQAMEKYPELRFELQEKYHYIMVDEFQDTNMAQMRILHNLTNNPVVEDQPNILVVGDDDQAIYSFQGADVGNILSFKDKYQQVKLIPLVDNYRSVAGVLEPASQVINQGQNRLVNSVADLSKQLTAHRNYDDPEIQLVDLPRPSDERRWLAQDVRRQLDRGVPANEIAIIAKKRANLSSLVEYFVAENISISYDQRDNVLEDEVVQHLILLARVIVGLAKQQLDEVNTRLPELLSHPAWGIKPEDIWQISLEAYKSRRLWLEVMESLEATKPVALWLQATAMQVPHLPLERMLDILIGNTALESLPDYQSPLKQYFFSSQQFDLETGKYISYLNNLSTLRTKLREHTPDASNQKLPEFLDYLLELEASGTTINSTRHIGEDENSVRFLTAHGSKGLEFDSVYIVEATDRNWMKGGSNSNLAYPENVTIRQHNHGDDDILRLFFVAMTRAKRRLAISYSHENSNSKPELLARFLEELQDIPSITPAVESTEALELAAAMKVWYEPVLELPSLTKRAYLAEQLANYNISATHVNNFTDIVRSGPQQFLLNNLLHFPSARSVSAEFGNAIHKSLEHAHDHLKAHGQPLPIADIISDFEGLLSQGSLTATELETNLEKGRAALQAFLDSHYSSFNSNQQAELSFGKNKVVIDEVRLTGKMDVVEIDKQAKEIIITDYKSGKPLTAWDKGSQYDKLKSHSYKQQLLFYKLLLENSAQWRDYKLTKAVLQFVEPDKQTGQIHDLSVSQYSPEEIEDFKLLLQAIWRHVQDLDFPDTSHYSADLKGVLAFERDLIEGRI